MNTVLDPPLRVLTTVKPTDSSAPHYVCFPPAGGTAAMFRHLAAARTGACLSAVQYPGRADRVRVRLPDTFEELAQQCAEAPLLAREATRTVLIGFSMGALLALETALRIESRYGRGPRALIVVGATAPHRRHRPPPLDDACLDRILDDNGSVDDSLRAHARDLLRADMSLISRYTGPAQRGAPCPVGAVCGEDDPRYVADDATDAWAVWSRQPFASRLVGGGHLGLLAPERAGELWKLVDRLAGAAVGGRD
ncbi:thioesterase II family protein [Streptomyces sp. NPDC127068]|uniref:thioesterase II family protein n=1 Tax=Streptomyces sp. NPDC127068 TaxID=3347127 RepID=UPI003656F642